MLRPVHGRGDRENRGESGSMRAFAVTRGAVGVTTGGGSWAGLLAALAGAFFGAAPGTPDGTPLSARFVIAGGRLFNCSSLIHRFVMPAFSQKKGRQPGRPLHESSELHRGPDNRHPLNMARIAGVATLPTPTVATATPTHFAPAAAT